MAIYYVRKTGNDTTGDGSTGNPWATIVKAYSMCTGGDQIRLGAGTYAETSGSGYMNLTGGLNSLRIQPETNATGPVIITAASSHVGAMFGNIVSLTVYDITFQAPAASNSVAMRLAPSVLMSDARFIRCRFVANSTGSGGCVDTGLSGSAEMRRVSFRNCEFYQLGTDVNYGVQVTNTAGTFNVNNFELRGNRISVSGNGVALTGVQSARIIGNEVDTWHPSTQGTAFRLGIDGETGAACSGVIASNRFDTLLGHAAVVGAGCDGVDFIGNTVSGGSDATFGQGLVVKEALNCRFVRNIITSGYLSGLYFKAAVDCQAYDNEVYNEHATSAGLRVWDNSVSGRASQRLTVRGNAIRASAGKAIEWGGAAADSGGSIVDDNTYVVSGAATLGTVRGTTVATTTALRAAWSGYDRTVNDANSKVGPRHRPSGSRPVYSLPA